MIDIVVQLGMGIIGLSVLVFLYVAILFPIMSRIGKLIYPDGDEAALPAWGFLALLAISSCGAAVWFLGGWLLGIL